MPTPGRLSISRCACSKTGTGKTAGPALKLKIRSVILTSLKAIHRLRRFYSANLRNLWMVLLKTRPQSFRGELRHDRSGHDAFGLDDEPVGPTGDHHGL